MRNDGGWTRAGDFCGFYIDFSFFSLYCILKIKAGLAESKIEKNYWIPANDPCLQHAGAGYAGIFATLRKVGRFWGWFLRVDICYGRIYS
jgi:hypothetical protein